MVKVANESIQAFPVKTHTYVGTASGYTGTANVVHASVDGSITFDFGTQGTVILNVVAGQDLAVDPSVQTITSSAEVWIS